jgi:tetratricopeptide (TPR) repeat protein
MQSHDKIDTSGTSGPDDRSPLEARDGDDVDFNPDPAPAELREEFFLRAAPGEKENVDELRAGLTPQEMRDFGPARHDPKNDVGAADHSAIPRKGASATFQDGEPSPGPRGDTALGGLPRAQSSRSAPLNGLPRDIEPADTDEFDPAFTDLVDEYTARILAGESVEIEDFVAEHPQWAVPLRKLLPTMRRMTALNRAVAVDGPDAATGSRDAQGRKVFGDFRIVREIARGGMGVVYEAEQVTLGRTVALKVLPLAASLDPRALQRFQLEAQVAGLLQHPRIVPVHAVGMVDDVPYYAMQYIEGGSLADLITALKQIDTGASTKPPRDHRASVTRPALLAPTNETATPSSPPPLDPPTASSLSALAAGLLSGRWAPLRGQTERHVDAPAATDSGSLPVAEAMLSICNRPYVRAIARFGIEAAEAVAHAHDQGIVHRDIKPANILLNRKGELWVADFGMADVQGRDGLTLTGDLPGTLRYMSPEQALGKRSLVDRRTDIYALGATLYELLALRPAVPGTDKQEMLRRIADDEPEPLRKLNPAVPVDLATIVTKCLAKDSASRYQTALQLADELTRFLDGRPIAARPVGALARTWRWCRRRPAQAALAASLALSLAGGLTGIAWNWRDAVRQRQVAIRHQHEAEQQKELLLVAERQTAEERDQKEAQRAKADAINRFLIDKLLLQAAPEHNTNARSLTLRSALDHAAEEVGTSFQGQPQIEAAIHLALGQTYHELGEYTLGESHLRQALERLGSENASPGPDRLLVMTELGHILFHLGRHKEAEALLTQAVEPSRRTLGPGSDTALMSARYLAWLYGATGRQSQAEALYRGLIDDARQSGRTECREAISARIGLASLLQKEGRSSEAEPLLHAGVASLRKTVGPRHPDTLSTQNVLARTLKSLGQLDEAEATLRETLETRRQVIGPEHPFTLVTERELAEILMAGNRRNEALALLRSCVEVQRRTLGPDHSDTRETEKLLNGLVVAQPARK